MCLTCTVYLRCVQLYWRLNCHVLFGAICRIHVVMCTVRFMFLSRRWKYEILWSMCHGDEVLQSLGFCLLGLGDTIVCLHGRLC